MNESLAAFMKVAMTMLILSGLIIGVAYQALKDKNNEYHPKVNQYQIQEK
jgi:hypothetical protein